MEVLNLPQKSSISYIQFMLVYLALRQLAFTPACIYAFLPNKTEKTYNRFLQALIDLAPNCRLEKILLDFEQADLQSFQKTFPEAHLSGCFFHLSQSYMRKINELGLKVTDETNHDLALAVKMLPSLAFEKEKIGDFYDMIVQEIQNVCDKNCIK